MLTMGTGSRTYYSFLQFLHIFKYLHIRDIQDDQLYDKMIIVSRCMSLKKYETVCEEESTGEGRATV